MGPMRVTDHEIRTTIERSSHDFNAQASLLSACITQFGSDSGNSIAPGIKQVAKYTVKAANNKHDCETAAKLVFNLLSKAIQDRTTGPQSRKVVVFFIANLLLKLYFRLQIAGPGQFDSISRNIISSGVRFSEYSKADRVGYRYYLGRYYLSQQQFRRSRSHLLWSFTHCANNAPHNKRLILIYLITASLPLGILASQELIHISGLAVPFQQLIQALVKGDYRSYHRHLKQQEAWLDTFQITLYLEQRCDMVLYRSLFRRVYLLSMDSTQKTPNVRFTRLLAAIRWATDVDSWDLMDIEALCVSMIDAGYIKGYIHHINKVLVLDKRDEGKAGFPPISGLQVAQLEHDDDRQFAE